MTGQLLIRGMLVGLLAGILAFGFAKVFGEPQIDKAIAFEEHMAHMHGDAPEEEELVSREVQSTFGLFTGVVVYSVSLGGIFALVFAYSLGRVGKIGPRGLAALLALAAFVTLILVPGLKYPPNPPSIGDPETIAQRTKLFFLMLLVSVIAAVIVIMAVAGSLFPVINEVPQAFSAVLLWKFRVASLGIQLVLWTTVGLTFGWLAERKLNLPGFSTRA